MIDSLVFSCVFLVGSFLLTLSFSALLQLGKFKSKELFRSHPFFFFHPLFKKVFPKQEWESLYFLLTLSKQIYQLAFGLFFFLFLLSTEKETFASLGIVIAISIALEFFARLFGNFWSRLSLHLALPLSSFYLTFLFPITAPLLYLIRSSLRKSPFSEEMANKGKIKEIIRESELQEHLDPNDQKLISSFVHFKERVAKEIMVPRVDLFSLEATLSIREASLLFAEEGYSRVPIHHETLDQIKGVVLYKDLLKCYTQENQDLNAPLSSIAKPVLYAPENKKIATLLQEFRTKQIHMAIIVDEYGGTEGVVTIEDILEELVGEIEDESDIGEEKDFWEMPGGAFIVDAKMTIFDIEEKLGIQIPSHPDYETIGGYIYHIAGTIPPKGWRLTRDAFDLEVLSSNERALQKIKLTPH